MLRPPPKKDGTVFIVAESPQAAEEWFKARGYYMEAGRFKNPEDPVRYVFVYGPERLRGLKSPLVYFLPGARLRPTFDAEYEAVLIETKAREVYYCS